MTYKPIVAILGCFIAGYLTRHLQAFLDVTIINTYGGIIAFPISHAVPVLGESPYFVLHHIAEYIIAAIIIGLITSKSDRNVLLVVAFLAGDIFKPVINSTKILLFYKDSVGVSTYVKSVLIQDLISSLIVLPALVIATIILVNKINGNTQPKKCT